MVVSGSGQANDPFLISADVSVGVVDNLIFDMTVNGTGTEADPWLLSVNFAPTARLADFPDVADGAAATGQVLAWNGTQWAPAPPTTAAAGSVTHGPSLTGDGSAGAPMAVVPDTARGVQIAATGVGLSDAGMLSTTRHFADATARNAMVPGPVMNTLTMLDTAPGEVDFWDGTRWAPIADRVNTVPGGSEFLQLSGPYNGITPVQRLMSTATVTTDGSGTFVLLSTAALAGKAGVFSCLFQETGSLAYKAVLNAVGGQVVGKAYNLVDGSPLAGSPITGMFVAYVY
jgi:hypothetical protein